MTTRIDRRTFITLSGAGLAGMAIAQAHAQQPLEKAQAYTFVVVADPHLAENREGELTGADKFRKVLTAIERLDPAPEFMLLLGDIHLSVFKELLPEIPIPVHAIAGNHESKEDRETLRSLFPDDFQGRDHYAFTHQGDLFLGLSDAAHIDHIGHFETETITPSVGQCEWLAEQLTHCSEYQRVVVFGHIPPEAELRPNPMCLGQNDARWLQDQVIQTRPTALFFGHRHQRITFDIDGIPVYGMPSCNWNMENKPTGFAHVFAHTDGLKVELINT